MNPLAWLTRRFPRLFGLEWYETEEFFETDNPQVFDMKKIKILSGGWVPVGWGPEHRKTQELDD